MSKEQSFKWLILIASFGVALGIMFQYWSTDELADLKYPPMITMILCVVYILLQIGRRFVFRIQRWWDWLYYLGLLGIILPVFFANQDNLSGFNWFSDIIMVFLIVPVIMDTYKLIKA